MEFSDWAEVKEKAPYHFSKNQPEASKKVVSILRIFLY